MKQLGNMSLVRRAVRYTVLCFFLAWGGLFVWGWLTRYLDPGPTLNGKSVYEWGWLLLDNRESAEYLSAYNTLSSSQDSVLLTAVQWTRTEDGAPRRVFFGTMDLLLGKRFYGLDCGAKASRYRFLGATIIGRTALDVSIGRQALQDMTLNPNISTFERETAIQYLRKGAPGAEGAKEGSDSRPDTGH